MQRNILVIAFLFAFCVATPSFSESSPNNVAYRLQHSSVTKKGGGYEVNLPRNVDRFYVREGNKFHAMRQRPNGEWVINRNWTMRERQSKMIQESGHFIDLSDAASRNIVVNQNGKRTVLRGDGDHWSEGGSGSGGTGVDHNDQDTTPVAWRDKPQNSIHLCQLAGTCGTSSSSSGSGYSSGSSSGSSGGGQFTPIGELTVSGQLPSCGSSTHVTSASQVESAVKNGSGCIILANGNYGKLNLNKSSGGTVVVKAENLLGAKLSGLSLSGSGVIVSGVDINGDMQLNGSNLRVSRCMLKGNISGRMFGAIIDRCDISGYSGTMMRLGPPSSDILFTRNYVHDGGGAQTFHNAPSSVLDAGMTNNNREHSMKFVASYNVMERHNGKDFWHAKSSDNTFAYNYVIAQGPQNQVSLRHGRNNKVIGNTVTGGGSIGVRDYNAVILGNRGNINIFGGDINHSFDKLLGKNEGAGYSTQPPARNVRIAGNTGSIVLGSHYESDCGNDPQPAESVEIYDHSGSIKTASPSCITWAKNITNNASQNAPASWGTIPEPITLSKSDVGPNAN